MVKSVHVLIIGGGISGLTLANLLIHGNKKVNFKVTIFEARPFCGGKESIGGGIGIWPPGQSVLKNIPNYQNFIDQFNYYMPFPSYRDSKGRILARAHKDFGKRFPVQCLNRFDLINFLFSGLKNSKVEIITSKKINAYERENNQIIVKTDDNVFKGDLLIACDGIHSKIRNCLMSELKLPSVFETNLGYTYFRANTQIPLESKHQWWSASFETWGKTKSKKYGNHAIRFGYVPLKPPLVFWFIAIKTQPNHRYLSPIKGVQLVDEDTKEFLIDLIGNWNPIRNNSADIIVDYVELINLTENILRTDIAKIKAIEKFPWKSADNRVILMGDSAHAIAPNVAQGAGLCMEDAAYLAAKLNRIDYLQGLAKYEQERKPRVKIVQKAADSIATIGQADNFLIRLLRLGLMRGATILFPVLQRHIFEYLISLSLGGSTKAIYWQAPRSDTSSSLFAQIFSDNHALNDLVKDFKTSSLGGSGSGLVSVERSIFFVGLPKAMKEQPFYAQVINLTEDVQSWIRIFGYKTPQQKTYTTSHSIFCGFKRQIYLSEGFGGFLDKIFQFIYKIRLQDDRSLSYESKGLTFFNLFKIPLPESLLPKSTWIERPIEGGWEFDGKITIPLIGRVLHYWGNFQPDTIDRPKNRRIIIAGGSGMIGKEVCVEFIKKGYEVYCLSRSLKTIINIEGVKVRGINEDWFDLIDSNTIILNLSGANPGSKRWTASVKSEIAQSRFLVIDRIIQNIEKANEKPLKYLQASAAGFYGDAGDLLLTEESEPNLGKKPGTEFRVEVCKEIEKRSKNANCNVINLRIGHVLSNTGGLLPYFKFAAFFGIGKIGSGNQYIPFVHINDVARAIEFIASNDIFTKDAINLTATKPCKNYEMMKELRWFKWGRGLSLPEPVLKLLIGQSSVILTDSERVIPKKLLENGFTFNFNTIEEALLGLQ